MDNKKVGNFISTMRKSLPLTQHEIAEILGVTVDELLNGEKLRDQKIELTTTELQ